MGEGRGEGKFQDNNIQKMFCDAKVSVTFTNFFHITFSSAIRPTSAISIYTVLQNMYIKLAFTYILTLLFFASVVMMIFVTLIPATMDHDVVIFVMLILVMKDPFHGVDIRDMLIL